MKSPKKIPSDFAERQVPYVTLGIVGLVESHAKKRGLPPPRVYRIARCSLAMQQIAGSILVEMALRCQD